MASSFTSGRFQGFDSAGIPLSGGKLYSYAAGTLTPQATYTTQSGGVANTNPVTLDSAGRAPVWLGASSYRMILKTAAGVTVTDDDNITEAAADASLFTPAGTGAVATTAQAKLRESVSVFDFMTSAEISAVQARASGADVTAAIQAAINSVSSFADIYFPPGVYYCTSSITIPAKDGIRLHGSRAAKLRFQDGAYIGLSFSAASYRATIDGLTIYGTEAAAPTITLVKFTGDSAYPTVTGCDFAYASIALLIAKCYVVKLTGNNFSNCDQYVNGTSAEGSTTDMLIMGETYGTTNIGTNACVEIAFTQTRMVGCYFETQYHVKDSLSILVGTQYFSMTGCQATSSGRFQFGTTTNAVITGNSFYNCYSSNSTLRFAGGGNYLVNGNVMSLSPLVVGTACISSSGDRTSISANMIGAYTTGISSAGSGSITGNSVLNCTTGISISSTSAMVLGNDNEFSGNTTDIVNGTTTATAPGNTTLTLTGCATSPTGAARYEVNNGLVALTLPAISATSNTTACTLTGLPAAITPAVSVFGSMVLLLDNGVQSAEQVAVSTGGVISLYKGGSLTGFTGSGTKGVRECVITYRLRNV